MDTSIQLFLNQVKNRRDTNRKEATWR